MSLPTFETFLTFTSTMLFLIYLLIKTSLWTIVKFFLPYQYRCKSVAGETVLITGSGSGIGRLMSKKFAKLGCKLVLVDVNSKANEETALEIKSDGGLAYPFTCDLSKREDIYRVADEVCSHFNLIC